MSATTYKEKNDENFGRLTAEDRNERQHMYMRFAYETEGDCRKNVSKNISTATVAEQATE